MTGQKLTSACTVTHTDFCGWEAVNLSNGLVNLVAVPAIGGRIMAYDLGGYPYLFVDPDLAGKLFTPEENQGDGSLAAWKNYGGDKTWPAPQGWDNESQWHGPPDPILDSGRYRLADASVEPDGAGTVEMVSPADPRTGVQISRRVTLYPDSSRVKLLLTFTNTLDRPIRWSIWDVVQLRAERAVPGGKPAHDPDCLITAPLNPQSRFAAGYQVMFGDPDNPQWQIDPLRRLFVARYQYHIGKVGLDSPGGWIAFSNLTAGQAFVARFVYDPSGEYPDDGAAVECWTVGAGQVANLDYTDSGIFLMEAEVLSPMYDFQPGEPRSFEIEWGACCCDGMVVDTAPAGCVDEPLRLESEEAGSRLTGSFGVFDPGRLDLVWLDAGEGEISRHEIMAVTPLAPVHLDLIQASPPGAAALSLEVVPRAGGPACRLAVVAVGE